MNLTFPRINSLLYFRCWTFEGTVCDVRFLQTKTLLIFSIDMVSASTLFPGKDADAQVKEIRSWLNARGVRDFEPVSLYCDQLKTVNVAMKSFLD